MKQDKIEMIGCFIVISILMVMLFLIGVFVANKIYMKVTNKTIEITDIDIDFEKLYPFEEANKENSNKESIIEKYKNIVEKIKEKIEKYSSKNIIGYEKFIENSYIYNNIISYKLVSNFDENARIELQDGYFSKLVKKQDVTQCANKLIELKKYLKDKNIELLYIQAPYKISSMQSMSSIYEDYSNENMDDLLEYIDGKVDYIDLRKNIQQSGLNHLSLFFKTDHHWLPETGLWAIGEVSRYLNDNYDMNLQIENINPDRYSIKSYPNIFLGSDGRYVTIKNAKPEDFHLITPNFETKLNVKMLDKEIDKTDTFENTLIDWSQIKEKDYYKVSQYGAYMYEDRPLTEIHNELVDNNKKILVIKDSFARVMVPFLALENENISMIDLRYFDGSLKTYISVFKPDIVLIIYNGNMVTNLENDIENTTTVKMWNFE